MHFNEFDFSYLRPPPEVYQIKHDDEYIKHGKEKNIVRKIFQKVEYDEFENFKIEELKAYMKEMNVQAPEGWDRHDYLLYCNSGGYEKIKSLENIRKHLEWLNNKKMHTLSEKKLEILTSGVAYYAGKDTCFRPIVVINVYLIDTNKYSVEEILGGVCFLLSCIRKFCFVPGFVENWVVILDTNNLSMWSLPIKILSNIISTLTINFTSTLEKLYILNPPYLLSKSWGIIEGYLHPETARKINFIDKKNFIKMQEIIHPSQLQEKYGGSLPNITAFWPPINTFPPLEDEIKSNKGKKESIHENSEAFMTLTNDSQFQQMFNQRREGEWMRDQGVNGKFSENFSQSVPHHYIESFDSNQRDAFRKHQYEDFRTPQRREDDERLPKSTVRLAYRNEDGYFKMDESERFYDFENSDEEAFYYSRGKELVKQHNLIIVERNEINAETYGCGLCDKTKVCTLV